MNEVYMLDMGVVRMECPSFIGSFITLLLDGSDREATDSHGARSLQSIHAKETATGISMISVTLSMDEWG